VRFRVVDALYNTQFACEMHYSGIYADAL